LAEAGLTRTFLLRCMIAVSGLITVTVQKDRPCVPSRIQGIYTITTVSSNSKGTSAGGSVCYMSAQHLSSQGTCELYLSRHFFATRLLILVVYIIALCSSINTTTFCFLHVCSDLDLTLHTEQPPLIRNKRVLKRIVDIYVRNFDNGDESE
jgi:hypothetical protein